MRILLPPSEAKAAGGTGPSLRVAGTGPGPLADARLTVLTAVAAFCRDDPIAAAGACKLPASSRADDLAANVAALDAPTMPALDRFTGIIYASLDAASLSGAARAVADESVLIVSGAFGLLSAVDAIPVHRVPMTASVPGIGVLGPWWRARLAAVLTGFVPSGDVVVDLRSTGYVAVPSFPGPSRGMVVPVRVLTQTGTRRAPVRTVISYPSKYTKGLVARALVLAEADGDPVRTVDDVERTLDKAGFTAERRSLPGGRFALDVII